VAGFAASRFFVSCGSATPAAFRHPAARHGQNATGSRKTPQIAFTAISVASYTAPFKRKGI